MPERYGRVTTVREARVQLPWYCYEGCYERDANGVVERRWRCSYIEILYTGG